VKALTTTIVMLWRGGEGFACRARPAPDSVQEGGTRRSFELRTLPAEVASMDAPPTTAFPPTHHLQAYFERTCPDSRRVLEPTIPGKPDRKLVFLLAQTKRRPRRIGRRSRGRGISRAAFAATEKAAGWWISRSGLSSTRPISPLQ